MAQLIQTAVIGDQMIRALIAGGLLLATGVVSAATTKLECTVAVKRDYSTGNTEKSKEVILLEINTYAGGHTHLIQGDTSYGPITVSTIKSPSTTQIHDYSDSGKWDISVITPNKDVTIRIDRNTGAFFYQNDYRSKETGETGLLTTITGNCKKIDMSKRKF